jgi:hypothetical protein
MGLILKTLEAKKILKMFYGAYTIFNFTLFLTKNRKKLAYFAQCHPD